MVGVLVVVVGVVVVVVVVSVVVVTTAIYPSGQSSDPSRSSARDVVPALTIAACAASQSAEEECSFEMTPTIVDISGVG